MTGESTVLFSCGPFCFGSATMAIRLARGLRGCRRIALCRGVSVELCRTAGTFDECLEIDDDSAPGVLDGLARRFDLRLYCDCNVFDASARRFCRQTGLPLVWVDMHLWRRGPELLEEAETAGVARIYETRYPGIEADLEQLGNSNLVSPCPALVTAPPPPGERAPEALAVVGLGGLDSPLYDAVSSPYPRLVLRLLEEHLERELAGLDVLVCASERAVARLRSERTARAGLRFAALSQREYLDAVARSALLLTIPSIHSPLEGFWADVPVVFLPPQNFTQFFHRRHWRSWGFARECPALDVLDPRLHLERQGEEDAGTLAVLDSLARLHADPAAFGSMAAGYAFHVRRLRSPGFRERLLKRQRRALTHLCPAGPDNVIRELHGLAGLAAEPFPLRG